MSDDAKLPQPDADFRRGFVVAAEALPLTNTGSIQPGARSLLRELRNSGHSVCVAFDTEAGRTIAATLEGAGDVSSLFAVPAPESVKSGAFKRYITTRTGGLPASRILYIESADDQVIADHTATPADLLGQQGMQTATIDPTQPAAAVLRALVDATRIMLQTPHAGGPQGPVSKPYVWRRKPRA